MKKNPIVQKLEKAHPPEVSTPLHQRQLKMALLEAHANMQPSPLFPYLFPFMKKIVPIGLIAGLTLGVVLYNSQFFMPHVASAHELIEQAIAKIQLLKPDSHNNSEKELIALEKAKNAKDLAIVGHTNIDQKGKATQISFTDEDGKKVVLNVYDSHDSDPVDIEDGRDDKALTTTQDSSALAATQEEEKSESDNEKTVEKDGSTSTSEVEKSATSDTRVTDSVKTESSGTEKSDSTESESKTTDSAEVKATDSLHTETLNTEKVELPDVEVDDTTTSTVTNR